MRITIKGKNNTANWLEQLNKGPALEVNGRTTIYTEPNIKTWDSGRKILWVNDLGDLDHFVGQCEPNRRRGNSLIKAIERADAILCPSAFTRARMKFHFPNFDQRKILVLPILAPKHDLLSTQDCASDLLELEINSPYFLHLGIVGEHDATEISLRAFKKSQAAHAQMKLAFISPNRGTRHERKFAQQQRTRLIETAQELKIDEQILWLEQEELHHGPTPSHLLRTLYSAAEAVIAPQAYECNPFYLNLAMASGASGVAAKAGCFPETLNGAWQMADWDDYRSYSRVLDRQLIDPHFRRECSAAAINQASTLDPTLTQQKVAKFLERDIC